jgi:MFS family permease
VAWTLADLVHLPSAHAAAVARPTVRGVLAAKRKLLLTVGIGVLLVSAVRASRQAVIPLWAEHLGLDATTTSVIYGLSGAVDMLVFYPAGKVMDRRGRAAVAVPSMLIMAAALLLMPWTGSAVTLLLTALLVGFGNGIGSGMIMTLGADYSPSPGRAQFLGVWRFLSDIGSSSGPALLSGVTVVAPLGAGIMVTGLLGTAAAAVLWYWIPRTPGTAIRR